MRKWVLRLLGLTLVIALFLAGATTVMAAGSEGPTPMGSADIEIDVQETGDWVLRLGTMDVGLSSQNVASLANRFALALPPLAVDQATIRLATDNGIQHLALVKEGNETTLFINGIPSTAIAISDTAASKVASEFVPELEGLISWLNQTSIAVVVHFPVSEVAERYVLDLEQKLAPAGEAGPRANLIDLGATLSPDGRLISVGGIAPSQLGFDPGMIDMSWMQSFGIDRLGLNQLDLAVDANGLSVSSNGDEWVSVAWNADYVAQNASQLASLAGFQLVDPSQQMVDLAVDWLKDTQIHVGAYLAEDSMEGAPVVSIGRPVTVSVQEKALYVEGFSTGFLLDDITLGYAQKVGSAAVAWDGSENQLRLAIGDKAMPSLMLDEGFLSSVAGALVGDILPWGLVEQIASDTRLTAAFVYEDSAPVSPEVLSYKVAYTAPAAPLVTDVTVSRADGRIAVLGEALPLAALGLDVSGTVQAYTTTVGAGIESLALDLGPSGLGLGINGKYLRLVWDQVTRANVIGMGLDIAGEQLGLPVLSQPGLVRWGAETLITMLNQFDVGIRVGFTDEPIPVGSIEQLVGFFF
ncbi:MAG: hypothetical protein HPY83_10450 [Anaerolineae bacterium]|nr:hypothetical protein [Anaerolineae bacterium]